MPRILIATTALALALSSYAWSAGPEDLLGEPMPSVKPGAPRAASPSLARGVAGADGRAKRYAGALNRLQAGGAVGRLFESVSGPGFQINMTFAMRT
jgi:hypothetical protein